MAMHARRVLMPFSVCHPTRLLPSLGQCVRCPTGCTCNGDVVQDCFPILEFLAPADSQVPVIFVSAIIECPLTVTGSSLCNPNSVPWPAFSSMTSMMGGALNLSGWCEAGHTDRLCSKCDTGYYSSSRWCLPCMATSTHIIIVLANCTLFIALVVYLYLRTPSPETSRHAAANYHPPRECIDLTIGVRIEDSVTVAAGRGSIAFDPMPVSLLASFPPSSLNSTRVTSESVVGPPPQWRTNDATPLRLLVFHGQTLSILLLTATSLPPVLTTFMSLVSSGSGFSISSILALECLSHFWTLEQQVWVALLVPTAVVIVALGIWFGELYRAHRGRTTLTDESAACRWYGVCMSLLYIFVVPCSQTALSAIACTDFRQYHTKMTTDLDGAAEDRIFLNLYPWVECNADWRRDILPPGLLGVFIWFVLFPVFSTLLLKRLRRRLRHHCDARVWPLCAELLTPFHTRFWYWEQVLLVRRFLLVACVAIIPSTSLYLPISLFALIQLSALAQHLASPYVSAGLNRGELVSLYLLLLNYITALVLHEELTVATSAQPENELNVWTVGLLIANLVFILVLIGGLFSTLQKRWGRLADRITACAPAWCCCLVRARRRTRAHRARVTKAPPIVDVVGPSLGIDFDIAISPEHSDSETPRSDDNDDEHEVDSGHTSAPNDGMAGADIGDVQSAAISLQEPLLQDEEREAIH